MLEIRLPDERAREDAVESQRSHLIFELARQLGLTGCIELSPEQEAEVDKRLQAKLGPQPPYEFDRLRELLAGTLQENIDYLFKQPHGSGSSQQLVQPPLFTLNDHPTRLFWGWDFCIEDLGTRGVKLHFLSRWTPPLEWLERIHDCYPAWHLRLDYREEFHAYESFVEWDGTKWTEHFDPRDIQDADSTEPGPDATDLPEECDQPDELDDLPEAPQVIQ